MHVNKNCFTNDVTMCIHTNSAREGRPEADFYQTPSCDSFLDLHHPPRKMFYSEFTRRKSRLFGSQDLAPFQQLGTTIQNVKEKTDQKRGEGRYKDVERASHLKRIATGVASSDAEATPEKVPCATDKAQM